MKSIKLNGIPASVVDTLVRECFEAFEQGYRPYAINTPETNIYCRSNMSFMDLIVNLEGPEKPSEEVTKEEDTIVEVAEETQPQSLLETLEGIDDYKTLKTVAEENNLEVNPKLKNPKSLKKDLISQVK